MKAYNRSRWSIIFILSLLLVSFLPTTAPAQEAPKPPAPETVTDGPYVTLGNGSAQLVYIRAGQLFSSEIKPKKGKYKFKLPGSRQKYIIPAAGEKIPPAHYRNVKKVFVVSDIHGQFDLFKALLVKNKVVTKKMKWRFGKGHLVINGDVFDRGPQVTETLWAIYRLERLAEKKGGKVHLLLGNHEVMVLQKDLRYVNPKYAVTAEHFLKIPLKDMFGPRDVLGRWVRTKNTMMRIGDMLFVHGGLNTAMITGELHAGLINEIVRTHLDTPRETINANEGLKFIFRGLGPFWYRGMVGDEDVPPQLSETEIDQLLAFYKVKHIIVGHTTHDRLTTYFGNRVIVVDAALKDGKRGEGLYRKKGKFYRATIEKKPAPLQ